MPGSFLAQFSRMLFCMRCVLGFDGGGTKTECVLLDETGTVRGRGLAGPSNPVNVGAAAAAAEIRKAGRIAVRSKGFADTDVTEICAGIAGVGNREVRIALQLEIKKVFPRARVGMTTDLEIALNATGVSPGIVVLAGTGSAVLGRIPHPKLGFKRGRAGGFGPIIGDPGSAYDLGRRALQLVMQRVMDKRKLALHRTLTKWAQCSVDELADRARKNPTVIFPAIFRLVAKMAEGDDPDASNLMRDSAHDLFGLTKLVISQLKLKDEKFFVGKTGGVFAGSPLLNSHFDVLVRAYAKHAQIGSLPCSPAEAAASVALYAQRNPAEFEESQ